jgi:hypothetical protein
MQQGSDPKLFEKIINFALNLNVGLSLAVDPAMFHLSPFLLFLL